MPAVDVRIKHTPMGSGHWMISLLDHLAGRSGIELDVVTAHPGYPDVRFNEGGIEYFVLSQPARQSIFSARARDLERCAAIVAERKPDIIHIHGSERFYGLLPARKMVSVPCVISLQGFLEPCVRNFFGALSLGDLWRSCRLIELPVRRGLLWRYRDFSNVIPQEREILRGCQSFMGRTEFDRAYLHSLNPEAHYYHVGEILRSPFYSARWRLARCDRHTILFTNAGEPRHGMDVLLRALSVLRREFPDANLRLGGYIGNRRGYDRFLRRSIQHAGLDSAVEILGYLKADALVKELERAHVFALASYIENSSNSLCEAMLAGLPCVASYAGGIPTLLAHGGAGVLFPPGEATLLADAIARIFRNDELAENLGHTAALEASRRHSPQTIISDLLSVYEEVISHANQPTYAR